MKWFWRVVMVLTFPLLILGALGLVLFVLVSHVEWGPPCGCLKCMWYKRSLRARTY